MIQVLAHDPRPSYQDDDKIYGIKYNMYEIKFQVKDKILTILSITNS